MIVQNGRFKWDPVQLFTLDNITLEARRGQLIAVVGTIGSGKSSLLHALAGEMYKQSGSVKIHVSLVCFCPIDNCVKYADGVFQGYHGLCATANLDPE